MELYRADGLIKTVAAGIGAPTPARIHLKGISGSLDAVLAATIFTLDPRDYILVLQEKEEAAYFQNDLQNLLGREILLFPMSYKRPYEFEETENANVLMRAEVLSRMSDPGHEPLVVVTYPEALSEKVVSRKSLAAHTFHLSVGEKLDTHFLEEFLRTYDFERTDFVYEAGQFAVRGGIIDVFSFANELPYRIELFGNEVESIRTFDPVSQISAKDFSGLNIVPNLKSKSLSDRQSFLSFASAGSVLWVKDYQLIGDVVQKSFDKAGESFAKLTGGGRTQVISEPAMLFDDRHTFEACVDALTCVEFGSRYALAPDHVFEFSSGAQPSFNKNFELLVRDLEGHQERGYQNFIASDLPHQLDKLKGVFEVISTFATFTPLEFSLRQGYVDNGVKVVCYTDHQIFERFHHYKTREKFSKSKALTLRELQTLQPGDFVTHIDYGIAKFAGLEKKIVRDREQETIRLVYKDDDILYVSIHALHKISRYTGKEGSPPVISKLGSHEWEAKKSKVKKRVKDIAKELIELYAKRKSAPGYAYSPDGYLQAELEASFIYQDTPDQARATADVKRDLELPHPMDRLVCGDVGFGKTEVAIRAAFKVVNEGKQVAVLVPTTILAMQHYQTFKERLSAFPVEIEYVSRFKPTHEIKRILADTREGKINILIGTHRIVG